MNQALLREIDQKQPCADDLLRGYHDAEMGVPYDPSETDDWKLGFDTWEADHGTKRCYAAWH